MMRSIFGFIIATFLVLGVFVDQSPAQLNDFDRQEFTFENALAGKNPGFESGTVQWTASGGTFVVNSGTQIVPNSKQFATWDSNASGQTLQTAAVTVPKTGNCEFSIWIAVPSGTATHTITVNDGTNDLVSAWTITTNANALKHIVNFPCPSSGTVRGKLTSVASNEPSISLDNARLGSATNIYAAQNTTEWQSFNTTGIFAGFTPGVSTAYGKYRQVGNMVEGWIEASFGATQTAGTNLVITLPWGVDGNAFVSASTKRITFGDVKIAISGSRFTGQMISDATTDDKKAFTLTWDTASGTVNSDTTWTYNNIATINSGDGFRVDFKYPVKGWAATGTVVMPDAQGWFAAGYISGGSVSLGTTAVTSYQEATNSSLTLTPDNGSAPMGITCSSTNAAATPSTGATTCSAGNESLGFSVNVPRAGRYEVCGQFGHNVASSAGDAGLNVAFEWVNTATNSQTIVARMGPRTTSGHYNGPASSQAKYGNVTACGQVTLSAGVTAFRLFYEQALPGSNPPSTNVINIDADPNIGDRAMRVTMRPITTENQAILANSVSTSVTNGLKVTTTRFTTTTGPNACVVGGSIDNSWISGTPSSSGPGQCSFTMTGFSAQPDCQFTVRSSPSGISVSGNTSSATAGGFQIWDALGAATTGSVVVTCIGPR